MATRYKVPSQAASGNDSFSDDLVGFQITESSSLMTNTNFTIEKTIPEKDSKKFITQPFSNFLTLDDLNEETAKTTDGSTSTSNEEDIKFNSDKENADKSLYGSLKQRIGVTLTNIISKYPASILVDSSSPIGTSSLTAERITYDPVTNTTEFLVQYSFLYNPFGIILKLPQSSIIPETDNTLRNFFSSYTKYAIDLSGTTYNIVSYTTPNSDNKITLKVEGHCFAGYIGYYEDYLIRPNNGVVENFYDDLDDLERALLNRDSSPKFNAGFNVPRDTNNGATTETITEYINWPLSKDGWNIQIVGLDYDYYVQELSTIAEEVDNYKSNLIIRFLTSPQLYEFDTEEKKIESIFQIYGQSFDRVKKFIDNIAYMRNVSYDGINNVPDVLLKNLSETLGLSTVTLFDEKALQDSLYTRHDTQYAGVSEGLNLIEAEYEFYRRILVNLAWLYKSKGTRIAIEFFLKFIGAPEPMIRIDEYVYKVESLLPSTTVEEDIRNAIQGVKITNIVEYSYNAISLTDDHTNYNSREEGFTFLYVTTGTIEEPLTGILYERTGENEAWQTTTYDNSMSGYTLTQLTGSTSLTRQEYPVDEDTGLPRGVEYDDGSMFFQKGAGWYRRTLDHRSPDVIDMANSDLASRVKVIKTKPKTFTYGEEYFNVFRKLPGLDYGYNLSSEIDNTKIEIVEDEDISKLTLNRKNVNVFLSSDRAIDYDIYRKSRDLMLSFGTVTPQVTSGITFAEFINDIEDTVIHDSHVIKYKPSYIDLLQVYNSYQQSSGFTPYNYISVNDFVNRLSPYWVNIVEQFIPATTLWMGGNVIENGIFNRSKFKHRQPCVPSTYTHDLYPDFATVISEDLETIVGGGTIGGVDNSANFRGLQLFGGLTFDLILDVNGIIYSGSTNNLTPFSAFTSTAACTILTGITGSIPLICDYTQLLTTTDPEAIEDIKNEWKAGLTGFTYDLNLIFTGATGQTINIEFFLDTNNVEQVKFTIIPHEYYGCTGYETFAYYFVPSMMLSGSTGNEPGNCELEVAVTSSENIVYGSIASCQLIDDVYFNIQGVGDESGVGGQGSFYVRTGCTESSTNVPACIHTISNVLETEQFDLIFTDAANCEQKITFDGLQLTIVEPPGYPGSTGITTNPIVAYKPSYNYGIEWGTMIYSGSTQPATNIELQTAITNNTIVEVPVESIVSGSTILAVELKSYSDMTAQNFIDAPISGYSFAYNYRLVTVTDIDCLTTTKISVINEAFNVLPTSKLLVYTNTDLDLNTIPYHFDYKYPEDLFVKDTISGQTGDYLINEFGFLTEVTGVTLNICSNDNYATLYSQINFSDSIDGLPNILFNGNSGQSNKIVVSYIDKEIDPLTFNLRQYFIGNGIGESDTINTAYYRDFTVISGYTDCGGGTAPTPTPTATVSGTPGTTITPTPTETPSITPSMSISSTPLATPSPTPSLSISPSATACPIENPFSSGLQACWNFEDSGTTIYDYTVNNHELNPQGNISYQEAGKVDSYAIGVFEPYSRLTGDTGLNYTTLSISVWFKTSGTTSSPRYIITRQQVNNGGYSILIPSNVDNGVVFEINNGINGHGEGPVLNSDDGNWHHYVVTYNNSTGISHRYYDGVYYGTYLYPYILDNLDPDINITVGNINSNYHPAYDSPFIGWIDAMGVWDRELEYCEVMALWNNGNGLSCGVSPVTPTPTVSVSSTVMATPTVTPSITISNTPTQSIPGSPSRTPSRTPSRSISATPSMTPSITPSPELPSIINFNSLSNDVGIMGISGAGIGAREFSITFNYRIRALVDNVWSSGNDPVQATTYFMLSTNSGSTWNEIDYVTAEIPGYGPPDESDTQTKYGSYTISNIPYSGITAVMVQGQYDCSSLQNSQGGDVEVTISGVTVTLGGGYALISCNNKYLMDCSSTTILSCGPEVTPTPTPTVTKTPGLTPSVSPSPIIPILIGFDTDGNISFTGIGTNIISILVRGTAQACQSWINCDYPPEGLSQYTYTIGSQVLQGYASETSATESNKNVCTNDVDTITFTNVTSGSTTLSNVYVNNDVVYCGDGWGTVTLELLSLTVTSGSGYIIVDTDNDVYQFTESTVGPTPTPTRTPSITPTRTPSLSISKTPSITPSATRSPSRTPSPTPAAIFINIANNSSDNTITNVTIDGSDVFNVSPAFPYYPSDSGRARSPRVTGIYSVTVYLGGAGIAKYATLVGSNGYTHCVNISAGASSVVFSNVTTNSSNELYLVLYPSGSCPSPTPSLSVSKTVTPSLSVSNSVTPTPTPTRTMYTVRFYASTNSAISSGAIEVGYSTNGSTWTSKNTTVSSICGTPSNVYTFDVLGGTTVYFAIRTLTPANAAFGAGTSTCPTSYVYCGRSTPYSLVINTDRDIYCNAQVTSSNLVIC
jgi:hypothetical protein